MDEQSRPDRPQDGQGSEDTGRNAREDAGAGVPAAEQTGKQRAAYLDPRGSESTRELRDTARRRRDAEEKLQQHLMEAKDHVPNEFHEHHGEHGHGYPGHEHAGHEHAGPEQPKPQHHGPGEPGHAGAEEAGAEKEERG